jgi:hypothetical protein
MVRSLSNKYVPTPSLDKVEIDLLHGLKDFCDCARKHAATVQLWETTAAIPTVQASNPPEPSQSSTNTDAESWHKPPEHGEEKTDMALVPTSMTRYPLIQKPAVASSNLNTSLINYNTNL